MIRAALTWLLLAVPAVADSLPALYAVTGVPANDVLNIRAEPDAGATLIGTVPADAADVEVVALSPDGQWAQVNSGEVSGYTAVRYLRRQPGPEWFSLKTGLLCVGTEPFWSLSLQPQLDALYSTPEIDTLLPILTRWSGASHAPMVGLALGDGGFITLRSAQCSDGMSDRSFGIASTLFLIGDTGPLTQTGCCSLLP